ncbi:MAG: MCP four helix bundle domain-containing protein, partial [Deltaproteobacteria bacterium]|nr:MCP four helix bundle domain-containing protein [Deltaproteobacteria bacterium]
MLKNMQMKTRLGLGFSAVIFIFLIAVIATTMLLRVTEKNARQMDEETLPFLILAYELDIAVIETGEALTDVSATHDPEGFNQAEKFAAKFREDLSRFKEMFRTENDTQSLREAEETEAAFNQFYESGKRMANVFVSEGITAGNVLMEDFDKTRGKLTEAVEKLQRTHVDEAKNNGQEILKSAHKVAQVLFGCSALAVILGVVVAFLIIRTVLNQLGADPRELGEVANMVAVGDLSRPITLKDGDTTSVMAAMKKMIEATNGIVANARLVAQGNLMVELKKRSDNDELMESLSDMIANLKEITGSAKLIAQGNLMVELKKRSDNDELMESLSDMVAKLREIVMEVQSAADNVAAGGQEMSTTAQQMSQGATEQAASAEEVSSSMEQMAANIRQNTDNAMQTEKIAIKSAADAKEGGKAVSETVAAM